MSLCRHVIVFDTRLTRIIRLKYVIFFFKSLLHYWAGLMRWLDCLGFIVWLCAFLFSLCTNLYLDIFNTWGVRQLEESSIALWCCMWCWALLVSLLLHFIPLNFWSLLIEWSLAHLCGQHNLKRYFWISIKYRKFNNARHLLMCIIYEWKSNDKSQDSMLTSAIKSGWLSKFATQLPMHVCANSVASGWCLAVVKRLKFIERHWKKIWLRFYHLQASSYIARLSIWVSL